MTMVEGSGMKGQIIIIVLSGTSTVRLEWAFEFKHQYLSFGRQVTAVSIAGYSPIPAARNACIHEAIKRDAEYMLFWDDDIMPQDSQGLSYLTATMDHHPEATLIGSVCPIRADVPEPIVVESKFSGPTYKWKDGKVHKVHHSGTGFLLIRIKDLLTIDVPTVVIEGEEMGEYISHSVADSDDYSLADLMKEHNKLWLVNGRVICNQIDRETGKIYRVQDVDDIVELAD